MSSGVEYEIVRDLNHLGSGTFLDFITVLVSSLYFLIFFWSVLAIVALIVDKKKGKIVFLSILIAIIIYFIVNDLIIKNILSSFLFRERPSIAHSDIIALGQRFIDSSFPSGHMASTVAILTCFIYFYRKTWPLALIFVLLMAFARMHNGMHYPSDVLAGAILGIGYGLLAIFILNKIKFKVDQKKSQNIQSTIDN